jgi:hypothetical protein
VCLVERSVYLVDQGVDVIVNSNLELKVKADIIIEEVMWMNGWTVRQMNVSIMNSTRQDET